MASVLQMKMYMYMYVCIACTCTWITRVLILGNEQYLSTPRTQRRNGKQKGNIPNKNMYRNCKLLRKLLCAVMTTGAICMQAFKGNQLNIFFLAQSRTDLFLIKVYVLYRANCKCKHISEQDCNAKRNMMQNNAMQPKNSNAK